MSNPDNQITLLKYLAQEQYGKVPSGELLTLEDAEKIMGQKAKLTDSVTSFNYHFSIFNCGYTALEADKKTGKTGKLYLACWQYDNVDSAHNAYTFIKVGNEKNGIKVLQGFGDEAYFHTDNTNFYFIIVRKDKKVFDMKVNKTTSTTSVEEFNAVAEKITAML